MSNTAYLRKLLGGGGTAPRAPPPPPYSYGPVTMELLEIG